VNTLLLYHGLKKRGVLLELDGERLFVDAPAGELTNEDRAALAEHMQGLIKLFEWEQRKLREADALGCVARWSRHPNWIELHDPTTGEWHEVRASECLPGVAAEANKHREQGGAA
jgi:hypothetical protein